MRVPERQPEVVYPSTGFQGSTGDAHAVQNNAAAMVKGGPQAYAGPKLVDQALHAPLLKECQPVASGRNEPVDHSGI